MSRVSLNRRLQALLDTAQRIDPEAVALHTMPPAIRSRYDAWLAGNAESAQPFDDGQGGIFAAILDGRFEPDPMPRDVAQWLGISDPPVITVDMTTDDAADLYGRMISP